MICPRRLWKTTLMELGNAETKGLSLEWGESGAAVLVPGVSVVESRCVVRELHTPYCAPRYLIL
jgi:hypothetical protein